MINDDQKLKVPEPVGGGVKKEAMGPTSDGIEAGMKEKYWEDFGKELELEKEISELGIEKVESGEVKLPKEVAKEMGIKPTVVAQTPVSEATGFKIGGISLTDDQLTVGKTKPVVKSARWLAEWFIYELLKAHFFIKFIKRKILRQKVA